MPAIEPSAIMALPCRSSSIIQPFRSKERPKRADGAFLPRPRAPCYRRNASETIPNGQRPRAAMTAITCIEDLRAIGRRKVPRSFFDYAEAGAYAEETLRANREDLQRLKFRQRVLVDVAERNLATTIIGEKVSLPLALGPIGMGGICLLYTSD